MQVVRISPHYYNTEEELEAVLMTLGALAVDLNP